MKIKFLSLALALMSVVAVNAQIKEGTITYNMTFEGLPAEQAAMMGDMETILSFKEGKSLSERNSMMGSEITFSDEKGLLMLIDQMGNKVAVMQTKEELDKAAAKDKTPEPKIEYVNETKMIAGYECKKAIFTIVDKDKKETKFDVWYSDKFAGQSKNAKGREALMKGLKGMPFEFSIPLGTFKINVVAKSVSTEPVPDSKFVVSTDGYKMITIDDLKAMQGGK